MSLFQDTFENLDKWIVLVPGFVARDGQLQSEWVEGKKIKTNIGDGWVNYSFQYDHVFERAYGSTILLVRMVDDLNYYAVVLWSGEFENAIREVQLWKVVNDISTFFNSASFLNAPMSLPVTARVEVVNDGAGVRFKIYINNVLQLEYLEEQRTFEAGRAGIQGSIYESVGDNVIIDEILPGPTGVLHVNTSPINGPVFINGVDKGLAPVTLTVPAGSHLVEFGAVAGYITPSSVRLDVYQGQDATVNGIYDPITSIMGYLEAHLFLDGTEYVTTIKIDGGASHDVPTANPIALAPGNHSFYVSAYDITRTFAITAGQTTIINVYNVSTYNLSVGSTPPGISFNIVKK